MHETIQKLARDQRIMPTDEQRALRAEKAGTDSLTIGCEFEVSYDVYKDIPKAKTVKLGRNYVVDLRHLCANEVGQYGYGVDEDGMFELQSPPARHPIALAIATKGLIRYGWLPKQTQQMITNHVSIGTDQVYEPRNKSPRFAGMLRLIELTGGTTAERLRAPVEEAIRINETAVNVSWNSRGDAGVSIEDPDKNLTKWIGSHTRLELRTLQFRSLAQHQATLEKAYYLSRALLAPRRSKVAREYESLESWFQNYSYDHHLPQTHKLNDSTTGTFAAYIIPFADHIEQHDRYELIAKTNSYIRNIQEEFGMTGL